MPALRRGVEELAPGRSTTSPTRGSTSRATWTDPGVEEREYRSFRSVRDSWPCYLLTLDPLPEGKDGVRHLNLMEMMARGDDLG
ncbi:MAG: hypothetical protein U0J70_06395 [Atopobiaceae bacterium]|nr:hypothetical protein [Atopobiaceae bacterium]